MTMNKLLATIALAATAVLGTGCFWVTTKAEGKAIEDDVQVLQTKVASQGNELDEKASKLEKVLKEATDLLARNSADLGQDVKGMDADLRNLRGLLNEVKKYADELRDELHNFEEKVDQRDKVYLMKLDDLDKRLMAIEAKNAGPQDPDGLYKEGKQAFDKGAYADARHYFKNLVVRFSTHKLADDAQYYRGESYMKEKSYEAAIREFQKIFEKYADSSWADDAFYRAGEAAEALKSCREARAYYGALRTKYKKSRLVKKAASRDAFLKKRANNKKYCVK